MRREAILWNNYSIGSFYEVIAVCRIKSVCVTAPSEIELKASAKYGWMRTLKSFSVHARIERYQSDCDKPCRKVLRVYVQHRQVPKKFKIGVVSIESDSNEGSFLVPPGFGLTTDTDFLRLNLLEGRRRSFGPLRIKIKSSQQ